MTATPRFDLSGWLIERLVQASPGLIRLVPGHHDVHAGIDWRRDRRGRT